MSVEDDLREYLTSYNAGIVYFETIEIYHPLFSKKYYLTREPLGITATLENGQQVDFEGANIEIALNSTKSDLDQNFSFSFSDIENALDDELDRIPFDDTTKITMAYRAFLSSNLTEPAQGPVALEVITVSQEKGVFTVEAGAPQLNWSKTGITYNYQDFPTLRAL